MVSSRERTGSVQFLLIKEHGILNMPSPGILLKNLLRFDWFVCSTNIPFKWDNYPVADAIPDTIYLQNCLNCLLPNNGLNSKRSLFNTSGESTTGISIIILNGENIDKIYQNAKLELV